MSMSVDVVSLLPNFLNQISV